MALLAVHLTPSLAEPDDFEGSVTVVVDILRATTTIVHGLVAGVRCVRPVAEIAEATQLVSSMPREQYLLAGEREGKPIDGFDLGNSPSEFTHERCSGRELVFTTTNGTRAILHAAKSRRLLIGAFVNYSAICQELLADGGDVQILCAGTDRRVSLEDTLFAGAVVHLLAEKNPYDLNDGARIAWDAFEGHGSVLKTALELGRGGQRLQSIGLADDIQWSAKIDRFGVVPEVTGDPPTISINGHRWEERLWRQ